MVSDSPPPSFVYLWPQLTVHEHKHSLLVICFLEVFESLIF